MINAEGSCSVSVNGNQPRWFENPFKTVKSLEPSREFKDGKALYCLILACPPIQPFSGIIFYHCFNRFGIIINKILCIG